MQRTTGIALTLIALGAVLRLLPHAPNFAPLGALALYGGATFSSRRSAFSIPIAAMLISDYFIGYYFLPLMLFVYGSFLLTVLIGRWVRRQVSIQRVIAGSLSASVLFFTVTNFGVWVAGHGYQPTAAGLLQAYVNGLPFFRNTLLSDLLYSSAFFGLTAAVTAIARRRLTQPTTYQLPPTISNG